MSVDTISSHSGSQEERRVWEAPRVATVVPLERTAGGPNADIIENLGYHVS